MKKRVLSVFLALALVTGLLPGTALATECAHETLEWSKNNALHWTTCVDCGADVDWGSHYDEAGDDGMCDACGIPIDAEGYCVHDGEGEWDGETLDYVDHRMTCSICGGYWEGHYDNTGDDGKCDVCAIPIDEEGYCVHDGEGEWNGETLDYVGHWTTCSFCNGYWENHYDKTNDGKCDGCGILIDENNQCAHDEGAWNGDQNSTGHHMTCSICGGYWEDHYDENGDGTCDVCGAEITVINIPLQLKAVNAEGEVITDTLDVMLSPAESDNSTWLANTAENYSNVYAVAIGENRLHGWDLYPSGYLKPTEEVTFTVNAKGDVTITSGNATVETTDTMTYIVITLAADTEGSGGEGEGGETPVTGSVTISGSAVVGQTLIAETSGFDPGAELSYQWWKSVENRVKIEGATESTYTLTEDELDWAIYCVVNGVESDRAGPVEAPASTTHNLWVGGEQITSEKLTITGSNGGTATFVPSTNTLTLNNYTYEGEGYDDAAIRYKDDSPLNLTLLGDSILPPTAPIGLYSNAEVLISGEGSLTIDSGTHGILSSGDLTIDGGNITIDTGTYGVFAMNITVNGGTLTAASTTAENGAGLLAYTSVTVTGGSVTASGNNAGISAASITLSGGTVEATGTTSGALSGAPVTTSYTDAVCYYGETKTAADAAGAKDIGYLTDNYTQKYVRVAKSPAAHSVNVSAVDAADSGVLEDASMQLLDSKGDILDEWVSTSDPYELTGLIAGESYHVRTTVAPSGYLIPDDTVFALDEDGDLVIGDNVSESGTIQVAFTMTTVSISAVDAANGADLAGATLQVVDSNGEVWEEWTSTSEPHEVTGLKTGEAYTLKADTAPDGYAIPDETSFSIREDGNIVTTGSATMEGVLLVIFERYTITIDDPIGNGTITADKDTAAAGETVTLTITPDTGYVLRSITVNGVTDEKVLGKTEITFTMPEENVSVSARFQQGIAIYFDNTDSGWTNVLYFEGFGYEQGVGLGDNLYGFIVPGDTPVAFTNYMPGMPSELYPEGYYSTEPFTPESGRTYRSSDFRTIHVATVDDQLTVTATPVGANPAVKMLVIVAGFTGGPTGGQLVDCRTLEAATGSATTPRTVSGDNLELFFVDPVTYAPIFRSVRQ